jgi:tetratricopeptide (TPR) repeat protein
MNLNLLPLLTEAERYLSLKDLDRAAECFVRAREACQDTTPLPTVGLARIAALLGRVDEATLILDEVLKRFPKCAEALTYRGLSEEARGQLSQAINFHMRALAVDPTLETAHFNLGRSYAQLGRWDLAAASYQLAIQHGARSAPVKVQLGTALFKARRTSEALKVLALTVSAHPKDLDAIVTLADVLVETGALGKAAELLDNAAQRIPDEAVISSRRAAVALRMKDLDAAYREARRTTTIAPKDEEAWLFEAVVGTMRLDFEGATKALKQVLRLNPTNWRAHYHLGGIADAMRLRKVAQKHYRAALQANPGAWEPLNNLAVNLLEEGSASAVKEARLLLERAVTFRLTPDAVMTHYNLAITCLKLGELGAARRSARELLRLAPTDHPMAAEAHRILKVAA